LEDRDRVRPFTLAGGKASGDGSNWRIEISEASLFICCEPLVQPSETNRG
jgi:hypothetical protein